MHLKSDNIEVMPFDNKNEVIKEIFESLLSRYQIRVILSLMVLIYCIANVIK